MFLDSDISSNLRCSSMTRFGHKLNYVINTFVKHTPDDDVGRNTGHNKSQNYENLCFSPSKHNDIHGKLNKIDFCYNFCHICHLGRLAAIIIDIFQHIRFNVAAF